MISGHATASLNIVPANLQIPVGTTATTEVQAVSVSNLYSMVGSSDLIEAIPRELAGKPPWKDTRNYLRQSPIQYAEGLKTPTLIMHSEQDLRCTMEQAEQMYAALKFKGVDCAFIRFPEESHGLSRSGRTDRRVARLKLILEWFDKYLK